MGEATLSERDIAVLKDMCHVRILGLPRLRNEVLRQSLFF